MADKVQWWRDAKKGKSVTLAENKELDTDKMLRHIRKELGDLKEQAKPTLRAAINAAAVKTKKALITQAKKTYAFDAAGKGQKELASAGNEKPFKLFRASIDKLNAKLVAKGEMNEIGKFSVSSRQRAITGNRPDSYGGKIFKNRGMSTAGAGGNKWFWAAVKYKKKQVNGNIVTREHEAIFFRGSEFKIKTRTYESKAKNPRGGRTKTFRAKIFKLHKVLAISKAHMYNTPEMGEIVATTFHSELHTAIIAAVEKTLKSAKKK